MRSTGAGARGERGGQMRSTGGAGFKALGAGWVGCTQPSRRSTPPPSKGFEGGAPPSLAPGMHGRVFAAVQVSAGFKPRPVSGSPRTTAFQAISKWLPNGGNGRPHSVTPY